MTTLSVDGAELWYSDTAVGSSAGGGDHEPVVSCQWFFAPDAAYPSMLAEPRFGGRRVIKVVGRGYPPSSEAEGEPAGGWYPTWAEDVYALTRALGIDRFVYTGVSHGAGIGWHLALAHPEVLSAFVSVVGVPHDRSKPRDFRGGKGFAPGEAYRQGGIVETSDPRRLARREAVMRRIESAPQQFHRDAGFPLPQCRTNEELVEQFRQVVVPTLILCGAKDGIVSLEQSVLAAASVPGARTVVFQDHGHSLAGESPEAVCGEVALFLRDLAELRAAMAEAV